MISDVIAGLGFLKDIKDEAERKKQEIALFESVKQLIIEFLDFMVKNNEPYNSYNTTYKIVTLSEFDQIAYAEQTKDQEQLVYFTLYNLRNNNKLTPKQAQMILNIIYEIPMKIFQDNNLRIYESLYFIILGNNEIMHQEEINKKCYKPNFALISQLLEEIQKEDWDSYIKTAIKELG